jgi:hypothetical protein
LTTRAMLMRGMVWVSVLVSAAAGLSGCRTRSVPSEQHARQSEPSHVDEQNDRAIRESLLAILKPVTLSNCTLQRFGSAHDGGYAMCANLIEGIQAAYSYGIGGNDDWGCSIASGFHVPVHQYDCFEPPALTCTGGQFVPHNECVGAAAETKSSRVFDTITNQIAKNGDAGKRLLVKIDVEGAEWDSLMATPDEVLERFDQLPMELHGTSELRFLDVVQKLKRTFHLVHLHFNNWACATDIAPFPAHAYQVLWVNKRVGIVGPPPPGSRPASEVDAPDNASGPDCQLPPSTP